MRCLQAEKKYRLQAVNPMDLDESKISARLWGCISVVSGKPIRARREKDRVV